MKTEAQSVRIRGDALQTQVDRLTSERSGQFRLNPTHSSYYFDHFFGGTHVRLSAFRVSPSCSRRGGWLTRCNRKPFKINSRRAPSCLIVQGGRSWTPPPERRSPTRHVEGTVEKRTRTGDRRSAAQTFGAVSRRARASRAHVDTVLDLGLPRPATKERGEGRGEGFRMGIQWLQKHLLTPPLSSILWRRGSCAAISRTVSRCGTCRRADSGLARSAVRRQHHQLNAHTFRYQ
jgi:hypothetical protein